MASTSGRLPPGERSRLKTDVDYLLLRVLQEFKNRDKYGRGLITGAAFSNVLDDFGLTYGQPEVAKILEYCVINGDGFVIYKDLIKKYSPGTPRAKQSESEKFLLKANELAMKQEPHLQTHWTHAPKLPDLHDQMEMSEFLAHQTEEIRRLYSRWDRGMLTDNAFLTALSEDLKVPLTEEFRHQLAVHGPARNLSFAKMLRALRIDNFLAKGTVPHSFAENPGRVFSTAAGEESGGQYRDEDEEKGETGRQLPITEIRRNPVTWDHAEPTPHMGADARTSGSSRDASFRSAICLFCDGKIGSWVFRQKLKDLGAKVTLEIDRLIRLHEADNSARVSDFLTAVQRQRVDADAAAAASSGGGAPFAAPMPAYRGAGLQTAVLATPYATDYTNGPQRADYLHHSTAAGRLVHPGSARSGAPGGELIMDRLVGEGGGRVEPASSSREGCGPSGGATAAASKLAKTFVPDAVGNKNAGDIIAWRGDQAEPVQLVPCGYQHERLADIITWHEEDAGPGGMQVKPSKRRIHPFGEQHHAAPFGTDADRGKTAEECETLEYRPATGKIGLRN